MAKNLIATISKHIESDRNGRERFLLVDIKLDGVVFRDHAWVEVSKRIKHLQVGDTFTSTVEIFKYPPGKLGIRKFRNTLIPRTLPTISGWLETTV